MNFHTFEWRRPTLFFSDSLSATRILRGFVSSCDTPPPSFGRSPSPSKLREDLRLPHPQRRNKRFLRDRYVAILPHPCLALFLLFQQLFLAADVAAPGPSPEQAPHFAVTSLRTQQGRVAPCCATDLYQRFVYQTAYLLELRNHRTIRLCKPPTCSEMKS